MNSISSGLLPIPILSLPTPKLLDSEAEISGRYGISCLFICNGLRSGIRGCSEMLEAYRERNLYQVCLAARTITVSAIHLGIGFYLKHDIDSRD